MIKIEGSKYMWEELSVNGTANYIEFDEQGNIEYVKNGKTTLCITDHKHCESIAKDIEAIKKDLLKAENDLIMAMDKLNKYI